MTKLKFYMLKYIKSHTITRHFNLNYTYLILNYAYIYIYNIYKHDMYKKQSFVFHH
jgi:hypothetical protein